MDGLQIYMIANRNTPEQIAKMNGICRSLSRICLRSEDSIREAVYRLAIDLPPNKATVVAAMKMFCFRG